MLIDRLPGPFTFRGIPSPGITRDDVRLSWEGRGGRVVEIEISRSEFRELSEWVKAHFFETDIEEEVRERLAEILARSPN